MSYQSIIQNYLVSDTLNHFFIDKKVTALDFIIQLIREHEQTLQCII